MPLNICSSFFKVEEREENFSDNIAVAFQRMCETEEDLNGLIGMGIRRLDIPQKLMPKIWNKLWKSFGVKLGNGTFQDSKLRQQNDVALDSAEIQALETIADKAQNAPLTITVDSKESISNLLEAVISGLREDDSLPLDLRMFILRLVYEARRNVDECAGGNDFELKSALQRLFGLLYAAETRGDKPDLWLRIKNIIAKPLIAAFLSEGAKRIVG